MSMVVCRSLCKNSSHTLPQEKASKEDRSKRVDDVIEELGLKKVSGTIIGNEQVRGVSGGERKRTNVSNELVPHPLPLTLAMFATVCSLCCVTTH